MSSYLSIFLGHIILGVGVKTDLNKVTTMVEWPRPLFGRDLRGFLGLTGYYRKFIRHYGMISKPLTDLLKKEGFNWNPQAEATFLTLKQAMTQALTLALPNFSKQFTVKIDACDKGIGVVLMQEGRPIG